MSEIRVVMVGIGGYGSYNLNPLLDALKRQDDCVKGVRLDMVDPYPQSYARLEEALETGARLYGSLDEYYAENKADLAVISTPIHLHAPMMLQALANGSNVLCEKPLCGDDRDIETLIRARDAAGKFVGIGYQLCYSDAIMDLKRDILNGVYGKLLSMKTIVLWPRDHAYYNRGVKWAGKLCAPDGSVIRDSVANNATAHYLFNMFHVLGDTMDGAKMPEQVRSWAYKANDIETFDTAVIRSTFADGAEAVYIGSHGVDFTRSPEFVYRFEKGTVRLCGSVTAELTEGTFADGTAVRNYGNPWANDQRKLFMAIENVRNGTQNMMCSLEGAAVETRIIAAVHAEHPEFPYFPAERIRTKDWNGSQLTYCEGLADELNRYYESL